MMYKINLNNHNEKEIQCYFNLKNKEQNFLYKKII